MQAAMYVRLSASRLGEDAPGLDRQREATERLIRERGWTLDDAHRFHDADTSAYRPGVPRPGFAAMRAAVEAGEVRAVVVWKLDRAFRRLKEAVEFLESCRARDVAFISVTEGIDTTTPFGPALFALFSALGDIESRTKSDRITAWHQQRAEQGLPSGGGTRKYGFKADGVAHEPAEVREIRKAARRLLSGESLRSLTADWNRRGVRTPPFKRDGVWHPDGGPWSKSSLRRLMTSARIAGLREHDGATYPATWQPIISESDFLALRVLFGDRRVPGHGARRYLLTGGVAVCGLCGGKLVARPKDGGRRAMVCAKDVGGCGKIGALAAPLEEFVADEAAREWERRQIESPPEPVRVEDELRRQLAADETALEDAARARYVTRTLDETGFQAVRTDLVARIADAQQRLERGTRRRTFLQNLDSLPPTPWETPTGANPEDIDGWRAWLSEVVERVVVNPAVRGRNTFDPTRLEIHFR